MTRVVISGTGLYRPPHIITNDELVEAFNAYAERFNASNAARIEAGEVEAIVDSSVEFIEKASGIKQRYVIDKSGVLDPDRMRPRFAPRADEELSLMAEIGVAAARAGAGSRRQARRGHRCRDLRLLQHAARLPGDGGRDPAGARHRRLRLRHERRLLVGHLRDRAGGQRGARRQRARVLVVNPEITSAHLNFRDRDCHFIFGDVCTAVVVERDDTATAPQRWEILGTRLATQFSNNIRNNFGFLNRCEDTDPDARDKLFLQEGRKVFKEVVPMVAALIERPPRRAGHRRRRRCAASGCTRPTWA